MHFTADRSASFFDRSFVLRLLQAESFHVYVLPVITDESFRIPRAPHEILNTNLDGRDLAALVGKLFQEIAVRVSPQDVEDAVLMRVATIARRMEVKLARPVSQTLQSYVTGQPVRTLHPSSSEVAEQSLANEEAAEAVRDQPERIDQDAWEEPEPKGVDVDDAEDVRQDGQELMQVEEEVLDVRLEPILTFIDDNATDIIDALVVGPVQAELATDYDLVDWNDDAVEVTCCLCGPARSCNDVLETGDGW